jgi:hypothetical protein
MITIMIEQCEEASINTLAIPDMMREHTAFCRRHEVGGRSEVGGQAWTIKTFIICVEDNS